MRCLRVMLVALWLIHLVTAQADMNSLEQRGGSRRYCGEKLKNKLMFLCESIYKRSGSKEMNMMSWLPNESAVSLFAYGERSYFPFKPRDNAVSLIARQFKRQRPGVVNECCNKPCTLAELSSYCGPRQ